MDRPEKIGDHELLVQELNRQYDLHLTEQLPPDELETFLSERLNALIRSDFNMLITILYRVDVSENKLKKLLRGSPEEDAGKIMARLIIERQLQKIKARRASNSTDTSAWKEV